LGHYAEGGPEGHFVSPRRVKPAIKELRPFPNVRLLTTEDLIVVSPDGTKTTLVAVKTETKENGVEVSIAEEPFQDGHLPFRDAVLDKHGTVEAAMHVLSRHFRWEQMPEIEGGTPVWRRRAKRLEFLDLWIIARAVFIDPFTIDAESNFWLMASCSAGRIDLVAVSWKEGAFRSSSEVSNQSAEDSVSVRLRKKCSVSLS
jgi:hypothetical protein